MTPATQTPAERRAFLLYYARVLLREARVRRSDLKFSAVLLAGAGRARREAAGIDARPAQGELW